MNTRHFPSIILLGILIVGCKGGESANTAPLPAKDPQARVDAATKGVDASSMTPGQKQAADAYLKQGATGAEQIRKSAQVGGSGTK